MNWGGGWMGGSAFKVDGECFDDIRGEFIPVELHYSTMSLDYS